MQELLAEVLDLARTIFLLLVVGVGIFQLLFWLGGRQQETFELQTERSAPNKQPLTQPPKIEPPPEKISAPLPPIVSKEEAEQILFNTAVRLDQGEQI